MRKVKLLQDNEQGTATYGNLFFWQRKQVGKANVFMISFCTRCDNIRRFDGGRIYKTTFRATSWSQAKNEAKTCQDSSPSKASRWIWLEALQYCYASEESGHVWLMLGIFCHWKYRGSLRIETFETSVFLRAR
jgi:hypothetical protein